MLWRVTVTVAVSAATRILEKPLSTSGSDCCAAFLQ